MTPRRIVFERSSIGPRQVSEAELRERFTPERGWRVLTIREGEFLSRVAPVPATLACIEYVGE
jgi:hypothetical protein